MPAAAIALIVAADEPALFFSSVNAAERYLEWIDVKDGVYSIAYDPDGSIYRLRHDGNRVIIEKDQTMPADPVGLNKLLQKAAGIKSSDNEFLLSLCSQRIER